MRTSYLKAPIWLLTLICCYAVCLIALTVLQRVGADRWWFGAFNLYLPQALWLLPGVLLIALCLKKSRRLIWLPALCLLWVLGPIMGFCWPATDVLESKPAGLRVMTWNIKYGKHGASGLVALLQEISLHNPDLILFQDAYGVLDGPVRSHLAGWQVRALGQYLIASKYPLSKSESLPISVSAEKEIYQRCEMRIGSRVVSIYNVHLQTPRSGLNAFRAVQTVPRHLPKAIERLESNVEARFAQTRGLLAYLAKERGPVILAGDLNSPDASLTCDMLRRGGLSDAHSQAGKGYGYTYGHYLLQHRVPWLHVSWMRIDHIMMTRQLQGARCWTGTWRASDHRPVIADLVWTDPGAREE